MAPAEKYNASMLKKRAEEQAKQTDVRDSAKGSSKIEELPTIPTSKKVRDVNKEAPGEFKDGRMGADIAMLISDITDKRNLLARHTAEDREQLAACEEEIELLEFRLAKIESRVEKRTKAKEEYEETYAKTELAFNKIVQTANAVANILEPPTMAELDGVQKPKEADAAKVPLKLKRKEAAMQPVDSKFDFNSRDAAKARDGTKKGQVGESDESATAA